ncbi:MAG: rhomboid family intramembrane serine protease [Opitutaceae bacterium]|nr:rhomboid family intramembrane serine protease [Opitutaceae bacterium]
MIPYRIETLYQHDPWANWAVFGTTIGTSLAILYGVIPQEVSEQYFVLGAGHPFSFVGYLFAHGGLVHLAGNMLFLWVFGNAVCATVGNLGYLLAYFGLGAFAGMLHLLVSGEPVIGASGAITGVVGMAVAFYPANRVSLVFLAGFMIRFFRTWLWGVALYWTTWDVIGAWLDLDNVAYWAHLGGTAAGLGLGLLLLATRRVQLTEFDRGSLLDSMLGRQPPHKPRPSSEMTTAQLQEAARAFRASLAAEAAEAAAVAGAVGKAGAKRTTAPAQAQGKKRLRLRLGPKPAGEDPDTPSARPAESLPAEPLPADPLPSASRPAAPPPAAPLPSVARSATPPPAAPLPLAPRATAPLPAAPPPPVALSAAPPPAAPLPSAPPPSAPRAAAPVPTAPAVPQSPLVGVSSSEPPSGTPASPPSNGARKPATAWPASLPEGRYFYFDGQDRLGPIARADFLARVSFAPDTSRWWFWVAGMQDWKRVSELTGQSNSGPAAVRPVGRSQSPPGTVE